MNHWLNDFMAEYRRQDVISDNRKIRLERLARESQEYYPGLFVKIMHSVAGWMILAGKKLHARYELPRTHSHQVPAGSFTR